MIRSSRITPELLHNLGPVMLRREDVKDVDNLKLETWVNGVLVQVGNTRDMDFKCGQVIDVHAAPRVMTPFRVLNVGWVLCFVKLHRHPFMPSPPMTLQILEYVSRFMTLFPGDVILTGRPPPLEGYPSEGVPVKVSFLFVGLLTGSDVFVSLPGVNLIVFIRVSCPRLYFGDSGNG